VVKSSSVNEVERIMSFSQCREEDTTRSMLATALPAQTKKAILKTSKNYPISNWDSKGYSRPETVSYLSNF